jgi:hypothetical protein
MDTFPEIAVESGPDSPASSLRSRIGPWAALVVSAAVHAGFLVWLATWLLPPRPLIASTLVWGSWENPTDADSLPVRLLPAEVATPYAALPADVDPREALATAGSSGLDAVAIGTLDTAAISPRPARGEVAGDGQGKGTGNSPGDGDGGLGGGGEPVTFFDIPLPAGADKFVFVVDASGSMHGKRFDRARRELIYTLKRLGSQHQFYVVFFNAYDFPQYHPLRTREFSAATPENIAKVQKWAAEFKPAGDTHPMSALRKALELRPDAIFFLSDGAFEVRTLDLIRQFNKQKTVIHTIGLEDKAGEALLEEIAARNNGKYHFVP